MFHSGLNRERLARTPDAHGTKQRGRGAGDEGCGNLVNKVPLSQAVFGLAIPVVQHACQVSVDGLWGDGMLILLLTVLNPAQQAKERKGRERKGRERKGREGKGREGKGREGNVGFRLCTQDSGLRMHCSFVLVICLLSMYWLLCFRILAMKFG